MNNFEIVLWAVLSFLISFIISSFVFGWKEDWVKKLSLSLLSSIFILVLRFSYISACNTTNMSEIESKIDLIQSNTDAIDMGQDCAKALKAINNEIFTEAVTVRLKEVQNFCSEISAGRIILTPDQVKSTWKIMVKLSKNHVYATNTIAPEDWPSESCEIQNRSRSIIKRIMIYQKDYESFNTKLKLLGERQLKECNVNTVQWIYKEDLYDLEGEYYNYINKLGAIDLVLVDDKILLLTHYDEQTKNIRQGILTTNNRDIQLAKELFNILFVNCDTF